RIADTRAVDPARGEQAGGEHAGAAVSTARARARRLEGAPRGGAVLCGDRAAALALVADLQIGLHVVAAEVTAVADAGLIDRQSEIEFAHRRAVLILARRLGPHAR